MWFRAPDRGAGDPRRASSLVIRFPALAARAALAIALLALAPARAPAAPRDSVAAPGRAEHFDALVTEFFDRWFELHPEAATRLGVHRFDDRLFPVTPASVAKEIAWLRDVHARLAAIPPVSLPFRRRLDRAALEAWIERQQLELEEMRPFERNPNFYVGLITSPIQGLLERDFASECARFRDAARRLAAVPEILRAARINLKNPPHLFTDVAIEQTRGALRFYRETVPAVAASCHEPAIQADLAEADSTAIRAAEEYLRFLEEDLRPRSSGNLALGRDLYQRKLWADEMERAPIDSLLARGWHELRETRERMSALARRITPTGDVRAALDSLATDTPTAEGQIAFVAAQVDSVRAFVRAHNVLTPPRREHLLVRETPAFSRSLSFASLDPPGVWETTADEAYLNVTPVDPRWSASQQHDHLAFFNRWNTGVVVIHEALPGHYYQFVALKQVSSRVRAALTCRSNVEGWAHYCEQMMLEQGYGGDDPRTALAQQWLALQRLGRLIVGLSVHTEGMTEAAAESLFEQQCWMTPITAAREARRGGLDPTYLVYTLGKWRILDLRDEVRAALGARYSPRAFHDALLAQGAAPLPIVRAGVLHDLCGRTVSLGGP